MDRRTFVARSTWAGALFALPDRIINDPYAPLQFDSTGPAVRVRGAVRTGTTGVPGVAVSDGVSVARTDAAGRYTLVADSSRPFIFLSVPAGYRIPVSSTGTAAFYRRLTPDGRGEATAEFTLERLPATDDEHRFLVLADPQTQNTFETERLRHETAPDVAAMVQSFGETTVFGVGCGDIMYDDLTLYPEYERAVQAMGIPFFQVIGNHDLVFDVDSDEASAATFERHFGPTYYSFDRGEVHYVVLDDVFWHGKGYLGYVDQRQQDWLRADLARIERGRTVVVFLHIPALSTRNLRNGGTPGTGESVANREALYRILEPYRAYIMSGHTHEHERHQDGSVRHHVHGAVCGAWWSGDICWDGTPNGYGVYRVRGSELRWSYKATGQPADLQMRLHGPGSDPTAPGDLVANIWDADPSWTVVWYEDGARRGPMSRRLGLCPRAVEEQTGPAKPERRGWVEPTRTQHLYYAPVSPGAREVRVEATDPWGGMHTTQLTL